MSGLGIESLKRAQRWRAERDPATKEARPSTFSAPRQPPSSLPLSPFFFISLQTFCSGILSQYNNNATLFQISSNLKAENDGCVWFEFFDPHIDKKLKGLRASGFMSLWWSRCYRRRASQCRQNDFWKGIFIGVWTLQGSNPTGDCKLCGKGVQKVVTLNLISCGGRGGGLTERSWERLHTVFFDAYRWWNSSPRKHILNSDTYVPRVLSFCWLRILLDVKLDSFHFCIPC